MLITLKQEVLGRTYNTYFLPNASISAVKFTGITN
jgi:hypothetical protein